MNNKHEEDEQGLTEPVYHLVNSVGKIIEQILIIAQSLSEVTRTVSEIEKLERARHASYVKMVGMLQENNILSLKQSNELLQELLTP